MRSFSIRSPRNRNEILIEHHVMIQPARWPKLVRRYATVDKAAKLQREGWAVWYPVGTGWMQR